MSYNRLDDPPGDVDCSIASFLVTFRDGREVFHCGDLLEGLVELDITETLLVHSVRVQFRGETVVSWRENQPSRGAAHVRDKATHWDQLYTVFGQKLHEQGPVMALEPGKHSFPFSTKVPDGPLPSSFEGKKGAVRYWVQASLHKDRVVEEVCKPFTVLEAIDINDATYDHQVSGDIDKTVCCLCFRSGTLYLSGSLDRSGYCPGEAIALCCRGRNLARREMGGIKARLIQKVVYRVDEKREVTETILSAIGGNKIERGKTKVWENQLLKIPAIPPSNRLSPFIKVSYSVQVTLVVPNGVDLKFHLPVTIGTVPRRFGGSTAPSVTCAVATRCTDGVEHFHQSSAQLCFPLQTYTPWCLFVENFVFAPGSVRPHLSRKFDLCHVKRPIESEPLLGNRTGNTYVTT